MDVQAELGMHHKAAPTEAECPAHCGDLWKQKGQLFSLVQYLALMTSPIPTSVSSWECKQVLCLQEQRLVTDSWMFGKKHGETDKNLGSTEATAHNPSGLHL